MQIRRFLFLSLPLYLYGSCSYYVFQAKHVFAQVQIWISLSFLHLPSVSMSPAHATSSKESTFLHKCKIRLSVLLPPPLCL